MRSLGQVITNELLEIIFPTHCLGCDQRTGWFCSNCQQNSRLALSSQVCQICLRVTQVPGSTCHLCRPKFGINGIVSFADYHSPSISRALRKVKYENCWAGAEPLARAALSRWKLVSPRSWAGVVPIPLAPAKYRQRGYNQSKIYAEVASDWFKAPLLTKLTRSKNTKSQVGLSREERLKNVEGVFLWSDFPITGPILLVDDVFTTGATITSAAKTLRRVGATEIWALVIAIESTR